MGYRIIMKYVQPIKAKGRTYYYYRRSGRNHGRLRGEPGSRTWLTDYHRIDGTFAGETERAIPNSFHDVVARYLSSPEFEDLSDGTKAQYRCYLDQLREVFGTDDISDIRRIHVKAYRDKIASQRGRANTSVRIMRAVMTYAMDCDLIQINPAMRIKGLKGGSHKAWPKPLIERVLAEAPEDLARVIAMGFYTAQRKSDVIAARWSDIEDGGIRFNQQKTGKHVWIPILPDFQDILDKTPRRGVMVLTTQTGRPWTVANLDCAFNRTKKKLGIKGYVIHGVRKSMAAWLSEKGATTEESKAWLGHESDQMAAYYTKDADQRRLAKAALAKLIG